MKEKPVRQVRPFQATISEEFKRALITEAKRDGKHRGIFFDTSGKLRTEFINPTAQYHYVFRTDKLSNET